jgi:probable HAF family extracellular repeat protein
MRPSRQIAGGAATTMAPAPRSSRSRGSLAFAVRGVAFLAMLSACRGDVLTEPRSPAVAPPDLTLTGGVGTEIFPTVPLGEIQPDGVAVGLNGAGQVTGSASFPSQDDFKAFRWSSATGAQRLTGCCDTMWGNDINDAGVIVGVAQTNALTGNRGFVAAGSSTTALSILPGANPEGSAGAVAINNAGQIVGASIAPGFVTHAVLWSAAGVIQDLGTLGGSNSTAIDINNPGQVIGSSQIAGDAATHFFLWSQLNGMQDLATLIDPNVTSVVEINDEGQIIGTYTTGGQSHAFLYTPGSGLEDLGTLGGTTSAPTGLNNHGDVVGSSTLSDGSTHAFLWTAAEGREDITALSGVPEVRRLNDNLQTITGALPPSTLPRTGALRPRLVQLQVTQSNAPPTAVIDAECSGLTCVLDASGSLDDKPGLTYAWNLDKFPGGSATGAKVTVTYPHAGQRIVTLTVTDAQGLKNSVTKTLTITDFPIASFTTSCVGLTCTFDASASTSDAPPLEFGWRFGDGQIGFNVVAPSHTYAQPGVYSVTLQVLDSKIPGRFAFVTKQVTVGAVAKQPPVAAFTYTCTGQANPHQCAFDATGSTDDAGIVSYRWEWGNGRNETKTIPTVRNTWAAPGTYTVTLRVTDTDGLIAVTKQQVVVP